MLTVREIEVFRLIVQGKSSKEVAAMLRISKRTVDFHLASIYTKLGASGRMEALRRGVQLRLFSADALLCAAA